MTSKVKFKIRKQYYLPEEDAALRYIGLETVGDLHYHTFKYVGDPEMDEYATMDGTEICENKRAYLKALKDAA